MKDSGRDPHRFKGPETSHSEKKFLANPRPAVTAIQAGGQVPVFGRIAGYVGIEKNEVAAANLQSPHFRADGTRARSDLHHHGLAVCSNGYLQRQFADVRFKIFFLLPSVSIQALAEVTLVIEQTDTDQGNTKI